MFEAFVVGEAWTDGASNGLERNVPGAEERLSALEFTKVLKFPPWPAVQRAP